MQAAVAAEGKKTNMMLPQFDFRILWVTVVCVKHAFKNKNDWL